MPWDGDKPKPKPRFRVGDEVLTGYNHDKCRVWRVHRNYSPPRYSVVFANGTFCDYREDGLLLQEDVDKFKAFFKSGDPKPLAGIGIRTNPRWA